MVFQVTVLGPILPERLDAICFTKLVKWCHASLDWIRRIHASMKANRWRVCLAAMPISLTSFTPIRVRWANETRSAMPTSIRMAWRRCHLAVWRLRARMVVHGNIMPKACIRATSKASWLWNADRCLHWQTATARDGRLRWATQHRKYSKEIICSKPTQWSRSVWKHRKMCRTFAQNNAMNYGCNLLIFNQLMYEFIFLPDVALQTSVWYIIDETNDTIRVTFFFYLLGRQMKFPK